MTSTNESSPGESPAPSASPEDLREIPLKELLGEIAHGVKQLATKEIQLAKAEIKADLTSELGMVKSLGFAALCAVLAINMLLLAAAFALSEVVQAWAAALIIAAPFLILAIAFGAIGWAKRLKHPLEATRATLKEDFEWTKNRLA